MNRLFCFLSFSFMLFAFLALTFGERFCIIALITTLLLSSVCLLINLFLKKRIITKTAVALVFAATAVLWVYTIHLPKLTAHKELDGKYITASGKISSISVGENYTSLLVSCSELNWDKADVKISVAIRNTENDMAEIGNLITFSGIADYDASSYNKGKECFITVFSSSYSFYPADDVFGRFVSSVRGRIKSISDGKRDSMLIKAFIIGDKSEIDEKTQNCFQRIGTSHLLAISGLHLSIIVMSFCGILMRTGLPIGVSAGVSCLLSLFYMAITGFSLSVVRAGQMMMVFFFARSIRRLNDSVTSLFIAGFVIVLISPWSLYNIGFLLSFFATFSIVVFVYPFIEWFRKRMDDSVEKGKKYTLRQRRVRNFLLEIASSACVTLSATAGTLPLVLLTYNELSLTFVIGNLITVPIAKVYLIVSFLAVFIELAGLSLIATPLAFFSAVVGNVFIKLTTFLSSVSFDPISLETAFLGIGAAVLGVVFVVFVCFSSKVWALPSMVLCIALFIPLFNIVSDGIAYPIAMIDTVSKSGANTTMIRWKGEVYLLDQTASDSQRLGGLNSITDRNKITRVDKAVFLTTDKLPTKRISMMLSLFEIDSITLVCAKERDPYEIVRMCEDAGCDIRVVCTERYEVTDGITALCFDDICTAFTVNNGDNSFSSYRSFSEEYVIADALNTDILVYAGKECFVPVKPTSETSFRLFT